MQVLEALSQCVEHIHNMQETLSLEHVRSLPSPVFHVIKDMYLHCRVSECNNSVGVFSVKLGLV